MHPVGPKPQSVYWRRRAIFLTVLLLTVLLIGKTLFGGGGSNSSAAPTGSNSASPSATASPSAINSSDSEPTPTISAEKKTSTPTPDPTDAVDPITLQTPSPVVTKTQPAGSCTDSEVSVKVSMTKRVVNVGSESNLVMSVKNISNRTCKRDVGSGANEVSIISGPAHVWSTDDCSPGSESNYVELKPGQIWSVKVIWNGKLSAPNCQVLSTAKYGAYWAHARNGAEVSPGVRFVIQ